MLNKRGINLIALIITIVIIVIIAAISTPMLSSIIDDSLEQDAKVEIKNVENVISYARAQMLLDNFIPNEDYIIKDSELDAKYYGVLSADEIAHIKSVNNNADIRLTEKYFLMTQSRFDREFGNGVNVSNIRGDREFIINYYKGLVVANYDGMKLTNGNSIDISDPVEIDRGEIKATLYPNGNTNWMRIQNTQVTFKWDPAVNSVDNISYVWSLSVTQPTDSEFTKTFAANVGNGTPYTVGLDTVTGNGWYLWIRIVYNELQTGVQRTTYIHSDAFFLDNDAPTFELEVNEIT